MQRNPKNIQKTIFKKDSFEFATQIMKKLPPIHPGRILLEEFLQPMGISQYRISKDMSVPARRINEIVHGKRSITADTALRLGRFFDMSAQFWLNLQTRYDLEVAEDALKSRLNKEVHVYRQHTG